MRFGSVDDVERALGESSYLSDRGLATSIFLALEMRRPLLLEGEAGVGKTEGGKTLAARRLPRVGDAPPAPARGRGRSRQYGGGQDARVAARRGADSSAVLRRHRRGGGALRVGR